MADEATDSRDGRASLLVAFAQRTSAHGVARLTTGPAPQRVAWLCIILGASCGFCVHLHQLATKYISPPISTAFSERSTVQFPWVTICPTDYMFRGRVRNTKIEGSVNGMPVSADPSEIVKGLGKLYYRLMTDSNWTHPAPKSQPEMSRHSVNSLRGQFFKSQPYQDTHESIIICGFNFQECSFLNFTLYKDEKYFGCLTFQPENRVLSQEGEESGLFLLLYSYGEGFHEIYEQVEGSMTFKVALHEPGFKPDLNTALTVPLASKTLVEFTPTVEITIDRKISPCVDTLPNSTYITDYSRPGDYENATFFGSERDCLIRLKQLEFVQECGCLAEHLALPADLMQLWPVCHELPYEVAFRDISVVLHSSGRDYSYTIKNDSGQSVPLQLFVTERQAEFDRVTARVKCFSRVYQRQVRSGVRKSKSCRKLCHRTSFPATRASDAWPPAENARKSLLVILADAFDRLLTKVEAAGRLNVELVGAKVNLKSDINDKYAILRIFTRSATTVFSKEEYSYALKDFFSDLGGILGLWVGVSVITLMELIELLAQLSTFCVVRSIGDSKIGQSKADLKSHTAGEQETSISVVRIEEII